MQYSLFLFALLLGLNGCGDGETGGPTEAAQKVAQTTQNLQTISLANGVSQSLAPYRFQSGLGDNSFTLSLKQGLNLIDFSQVSFYDKDRESDAVLSIKDINNQIKAFITQKSETNLSDTTIVYQLYLQEAQSCSFEIKMPDNQDSWKINVVHKSQLDNQLQTLLKDPLTPKSIAGDDILYPYQWHLKNTGQSEYVLIDAIAGNDINVEPVWQMGYTGKGVSVAIIDEGVEINHPDLRENIDIFRSWNYLSKSYDTSPSDATHAHGTAVAGIIGAKANNGIGGRGVAPDATLVSYNMIESQSLVDWSLPLESLLRNLDTIDIYNNSWGLEAGTLYPNPPLETSVYNQISNQIAYGIKHGRDGKGAIYIKSAGNDRLSYKSDSLEFEPYWNANFDPQQVDRYTVVVGASNADGEYSEYSNPGANLLVNAPGGDSNSPTLTLDQYQIVSTDLSGKSQGYDFQDDNLFDYHFETEGNENYDYTDRMNGTSAAGPNVAGVVALMLEANPELTWRDVRYILATTATKNGSGYIQNDAGHSFSNDYGFGRVNAQAAVQKSIAWDSLSKEFSAFAKGESQLSYNDNNESNLSKSSNITLSVNENLIIEYVNVEFSLDVNASENAGSLPDAGQIEVKLVSPNGTPSLLIDAPNGLADDAQFIHTRVGSNSFLDERSQGEWKLYISEIDAEKDPTDLRAFKVSDIKLEIYGRK